jgi:uncharacterized BrkB/YihY/UPF0761 family membrane protein
LLGRLAGWLEHARALRSWVEAARRRSAALDATLETIERDSEIGGGMLAGALSYRLFVFSLPLSFFLISGIGLLASAIGRKPDLIVNSVGFAGVITRQVANASQGSSSWWVALSAFVALVYVTRVLLRAVTIVHALAWERSAASVKVSARSLGVFSAMVLAQLGLVAAVGAINHRTPLGGLVALVLFVFVLAGLWLVLSLHVPHADARWTDLIPGSLFYAIGMVAVVLFNILLFARLLEEKSSTYGALGLAATLLLGLFLIGRVIVGAAVVNVTLYERRARKRDRRESPPAPSDDRADEPAARHRR